ncbi:MAG: glycosyltransferase family 2 protein [Gammaproteobacteria bacterium]|nr:glycosyltransferase family 2 protein [Gammaproteobacteria bacterium]
MTELSSPAPADVLYSVVVPFFNEQDNVAPLLDEIGAVMAALGNYEVVTVDDCSTDGTRARLLACAADPRVRVVAHGCNRGQSAALCSGVDAARGAWVITLDGDGQNDPRDIPRLLAAIAVEQPPLLVCGHRQKRRDNGLRLLSSRIANGVRSRMLGDDTPDTGCGLKLMHRAAFMKLPRFDHMHRFLPALIRRDGGGILSVPVSHRARVHGQSKYGVWNRLWVGIVDLFGVMWLKRRAFRAAPVEELKHER